MLHNFIVKNNTFHIGSFTAEELVKKYGSPLYVYDAEIIRRRFSDLKDTITYPKVIIHYACKANTNNAIMKLLRKEGAYIETVSKGEVLAALKAGYLPEEIIFTCSNITRDELAFIIKKDITINLDSLTQLRRFGELNPGGKVSIRINQGIGAGHHGHVITGGPDSKFGIELNQITEAKALAKKFKLKIIGIHQHIGSSILDQKIFMQAINKLLETATQFNDLEFIDFGGGFGIPYKSTELPLDMKKLGQAISNALNQFTKSYGKQLIMRFEPGRYLVAESGVLLTTVTDIKKTSSKIFVGVDSGFNHFIRPTMYESHHEIINANKVNGIKDIVTIAGNVCESGDVFGKNRKLTKSKEGDIIAILDAGAYGYAMSSLYNSRSRPAEVLIEKNKSRIIRKVSHE